MKKLKIIALLLIYASCSHAHPNDGFRQFKARNGVKFEFKVFLPNDYQPSKKYPALVAFSDVTYNLSVAEDLVNLIWDQQDEKNYILVLPLAPKGSGWINHPAHHALEEFLNDIKSEYKIKNDQFNSFGYKKGSIPSYTWMYMSKKFFRSMTYI